MKRVGLVGVKLEGVIVDVRRLSEIAVAMESQTRLDGAAHLVGALERFGAEGVVLVSGLVVRGHEALVASVHGVDTFGARLTTCRDCFNVVPGRS